MKIKNIILVLFLTVLMFGCDFSTDDGGSASGTVSGTITVGSESDWTNLKVGFFPAFNNSDGLDSETQDRTAGGEEGYLYYSDVNDDSIVTIEPDAVTDVSNNSSSSSSYNLTLPSDPSVSGDSSYYYYLAIWADSDSDGAIDLSDKSWFDITSNNAGEFSRLPLKSMGNPNPAYIHSWTYLDSDSVTGYKYNGYDGVTNYANKLSDGNSGFNFEVAQ